MEHSLGVLLDSSGQMFGETLYSRTHGLSEEKGPNISREGAKQKVAQKALA